MLSFIHSFGDLTILFVTVASCATISIFMPFVGRRILPLKQNEDREKAVLDALKGVASILGVLLAFSLVQAQNNLKAAQDLVVKEASLGQAMDRMLLRSGKPDFAADRPLLATYIRARIEDEWPAMRNGRRSVRTDVAMHALSVALRSDTPLDLRKTVAYGEILKTLDDLGDLRELTISESNPELYGLSSFYWTTILVFMLVVFALGLFIGTTPGALATAMSATCAVALMLAMLMIVDEPFRGQTSVSSEPLQQTLLLNAHRL
jgi:hypothetical protein